MLKLKLPREGHMEFPRVYEWRHLKSRQFWVRGRRLGVVAPEWLAAELCI